MTIAHIAALGSSFAAGPRIRPVEDKAAGRSSRNYPHLLAQRFGALLTDLTVSGATTANLLDTPQRMLSRRFAPQVHGVPPDADLVTITAGGNDLRYAVHLIQRGYAGRFAQNPLLRPLTGLLTRRGLTPPAEQAVDAAVTNLVRVVEAVHARTKDARVLLVDYLTVLGPGTQPGPEAPFDRTTLDALRQLGDHVSSLFTKAAQRSDAELVPMGELSRDHAVGSPEPWVTGMPVGPRPHGAPFHPNAAGMAAVANAVAERVGG